MIEEIANVQDHGHVRIDAVKRREDIANNVDAMKKEDSGSGKKNVDVNVEDEKKGKRKKDVVMRKEEEKEERGHHPLGKNLVAETGEMIEEIANVQDHGHVRIDAVKRKKDVVMRKEEEKEGRGKKGREKKKNVNAKREGKEFRKKRRK